MISGVALGCMLRALHMETLRSSLKIAVSERNAIAIASLVSVLIGAPVLAASALGLAATLGAIELNIIKRRRELLQFKKSDPVHYLVAVMKNIT